MEKKGICPGCDGNLQLNRTIEYDVDPTTGKIDGSMPVIDDYLFCTECGYDGENLPDIRFPEPPPQKVIRVKIMGKKVQTFSSLRDALKFVSKSIPFISDLQLFKSGLEVINEDGVEEGRIWEGKSSK